jgi:hypothetical protein
MNNTLIKPLETITGKRISSSKTSLTKKLKMCSKHINHSKYDLIGFVDRTNDVILRPRYHNVRNSLGQFAAVIE